MIFKLESVSLANAGSFLMLAQTDRGSGMYLSNNRLVYGFNQFRERNILCILKLVMVPLPSKLSGCKVYTYVMHRNIYINSAAAFIDLFV